MLFSCSYDCFRPENNSSWLIDLGTSTSLVNLPYTFTLGDDKIVNSILVRKRRSIQRMKQDPKKWEQHLKKERERNRRRREISREKRAQDAEARKLWKEKEKLRKRKIRGRVKKKLF